jgi:ArsR family transcriptional regulator
MEGAKSNQDVARYADMFAAMGAEPRLRILQLLLTAHPEGLVVGDILQELGIAPSTLSHHLEKLKNEDLVRVRREGTFLWYTANTESLGALMNFLYAECCTRGAAVEPVPLITICKPERKQPRGKSDGTKEHQANGHGKVRTGGFTRRRRR